MTEFLLFIVDGQQFGLPVTNIDHVVRMVMITPIIAAPQAVAGIINYHGVILPVFSIRMRLSFPDRPSIPDDLLIITGSAKRKVALIADQVKGVIHLSEEIIHADEILPGITGVQGVIRTSDGMILITDIDRFLLPEEEVILKKILSSEEGGKTG
ncbi:MAG: chemotaxis protein CheW [Methanobacteriota archaeon]